ncbi:MAG: helix-turn-helix transcriptional regulator [Clostridia bacterium]|nr:helix-turn-helix transcriptional regulator [Clostridia bacterium]
MSVTEWEQKWTTRKTYVWKGFLKASPIIWVMFRHRAIGQKMAFVPLIRIEVGFFEHDTLRWKKQNAFTHQPYHVLQSIPDRIRWLRLQRGLTQQEAADLLGVGRSTYIDYEIGTIERFDLQVIRRMSLLYQVPMDDLLDKYNIFLMNGQGEQMKRWRMNLGYSCKAMGKYLGVATSNIVAWEKEEKIMTRKLWERCFGFRKTK